MKNLYDSFIAALHAAQATAPNSYLLLLAKHISKVSSFEENDSINQIKEKMLSLCQQSDFALNPTLVSQFSQLFGEAHFIKLCHDQGVHLKKVPEGIKKTPDFKYEDNTTSLFFEVKTLSPVGGSSQIENDLEQSLDAQIDIERQINSGKFIATGVSVQQPYAEKPYKLGLISGVIDSLLEKIRQNIKQGQYHNPNSFLVINLCMLSISPADLKILRPVYFNTCPFETPITGSLWMTAFGQQGMIIHTFPEFEGKPCIEGVFNKLGILADQEYEQISGLLFIVYPLSGDPFICTALRNKDYTRLSDEESETLEIILRLCQNKWNDDIDSNGFELI